MNKPKRGRPLTFDDTQRQQLAELVRVHGARQARRQSPIPISHHTLLRIAHEFGIELRKGRRPREAA